MVSFSRVSTGIEGLDNILNYLQTGDNVVLQVDDMEDYRSFVFPSSKRPWRTKNGSSHALRPAMRRSWRPRPGGTIYKLNADMGFESFSTQVHNIICRNGPDVFYVSTVSRIFCTPGPGPDDRQLFVITCPYLFELNTVAYFAILRSPPFFQDDRPDPGETQVLPGHLQLQGKALRSPPQGLASLFTYHVPSPYPTNGRFTPIMNSVDATNLFAFLATRDPSAPSGIWITGTATIVQARELAQDPEAGDAKRSMVDQLSRVPHLAGRSGCCRWQRIFSTWRICWRSMERLIGTGFIAEKSVGMLLPGISSGRTGPSNGTPSWSATTPSISVPKSFTPTSFQIGWWKLLMAEDQGRLFRVRRGASERHAPGRFPGGSAGAVQ